MHVAVIGAGFTGAVLTIELMERLPEGSRVTLVDRRGVFGPGLAYSTRDSRHLLNVAAARMSARADDADQLVDWLARHHDDRGDAYGPGSFIPRWLYGLYLQETLAAAAIGSGMLLDRISGEAVGVTRAAGGFRVALRGGPVIEADRVALCTGQRLATPFVEHAGFPAAAPRIVADPWAEGWRERIDRKDRVLLVGTGLTMVDQALSLVAAGHDGPLTAVSRRGLLNAAHLPRRAEPRPIPGFDPAAGLRAIVRQVRAEVTTALAQGDDWRPILDGLRPQLPDIWQALSHGERARFLRHLRPYWEAHRHRVAPQVATEIGALVEARRLRVVSGRIEAVIPGEREVEVRLRRRGENAPRTKEFDWLVVCAGMEADFRRSGDPLPNALARAGLVRPGPYGLGIDIDEVARPLDRQGRPVEGLHALGPLGKGTLWEITGVNEIRRQCASAAGAIAMPAGRAAVAGVPATAVFRAC